MGIRNINVDARLGTKVDNSNVMVLPPAIWRLLCAFSIGTAISITVWVICAVRYGQVHCLFIQSVLSYPSLFQDNAFLWWHSHVTQIQHNCLRSWWMHPSGKTSFDSRLPVVSLPVGLWARAAPHRSLKVFVKLRNIGRNRTTVVVHYTKSWKVDFAKSKEIGYLVVSCLGTPGFTHSSNTKTNSETGACISWGGIRSRSMELAFSAGAGKESKW